MAQPITPELLAILQSKLQGGAKGHRALVEIGSDALVDPSSVLPGVLDLFDRTTTPDDIGGAWTTDDISLATAHCDGAKLTYHSTMEPPAVSVARYYRTAADASFFVSTYLATTTIFTGKSGRIAFGVGGTYTQQHVEFGLSRLSGGWYLIFDTDGTNTVTVGPLATVSDDSPKYLEFQYDRDGYVLAGRAWDAVAGELPTVGQPGYQMIVDLSAIGGFDTTNDTLKFWLQMGDWDVLELDWPASGIRAWTEYQPSTIETEKSFSSDADTATVEIPDPSSSIQPLVTDPVIDIERRIRIWQWYGDVANKVKSFEGLVDEVAGHRDPTVITLRAKDRMKLLINESVIPTDPQGATDTDTVRTPDNFVWLNANAIDIINGLLDRAGWPSDARSITDTNQVIPEFIATLNDTFAAAIRRVCNLVVYEMSVDEAGVFQCHPRPSALTGEGELPTPVASFSGAREVYVIDAGLDDNELKTRVSVFGAAAVAATETWNEIWNANVVGQPNGLYDRPDGELYAIDGKKRLIYLLNNGEDKPTGKSQITASALSAHSCDGGMDGFPGIDYYVVVLETPFRDSADGLGSSSADCRLLLVNLNTGLVLSSHAVLGAGTYTAVRCTGSHIYVTRFDNQTIKKFDTSFALVDTIDISSIGSPTGLAIDGTNLWIFAGGTISVVDESAPTVVITTHPAPGAVGGGEIDSSDNSYLYADVPGAGLIYKYQLATPPTPAISADAIDYALEDALGARAEVDARTHTGCPFVIGDHAFERRLYTLSDETLASITQAQDTANRLLARLSKKRRTVQIGIIAQPQLQKGDPIEVHDPPSGLDHQLVMIDTYQTSQRESTYLGTISGPLWVVDY